MIKQDLIDYLYNAIDRIDIEDQEEYGELEIIDLLVEEGIIPNFERHRFLLEIH